MLELTKRSKKPLLFGGCSFSILGGQIRKFKTRNQTLLPNKYYSVAVTSKLLYEPEIFPLFKGLDYKRIEGITLWDSWKNELPSIKISPDLLDN